MSVGSINSTTPISGGDISIKLASTISTNRIQDLVSVDSPNVSLDVHPNTLSSDVCPLALKTACDLKAEHKRYAQALLRTDTEESSYSNSDGVTSTNPTSSVTEPQTEGLTVSALSVIRFARAPSRIPRLQRDSTASSAPSSQHSRASSSRTTTVDIVGAMVNEPNDVFSVGPTSGARIAGSSLRQNSFSKALGQDSLAVKIDPSKLRIPLHLELPGLPCNIQDLAAADSYLSTLEVLLGVTPPRPHVSTSPNLSPDLQSEDEVSFAPQFDALISANLARVASRRDTSTRQILDSTACSHIVALEMHLESLAARIPLTSSPQKSSTDAEDRLLCDDNDVRSWLIETSAIENKDEIYLPRLEAHLEALLTEVEQRMLSTELPTK